MNTDTPIAVNRFGLGARPRELAAAASDSRAWLIRQIAGPQALPAAVQALPGSAQVFQQFVAAQQERAAKSEKSSESPAARVAMSVREVMLPMYRQQVAARYQVAGTSEAPFHERLVHFWSNHFAVSAEKPSMTGLAGTLENEAIRPHLGGRFLDLLLAVETHPAMLLYLDNQASTGPNSRLAQRGKREDRKLGLNENLAREILELHTLGVDGGYTQADVTTFAGAITGWSVGGGRGRIAGGEPGRFVFRDAMHEPGDKTVFGKRYRDAGLEQGRAILEDLAGHPATARHIATKLARHFIADEPPRSAVERIAEAFHDSGGDLPTVHRALIESPEAWTQPFAKFKTPHEFVISTFRALDFVPDNPQQVLAPFQLLGQPPYRPGSPAGWPDTADQWDGPDALMKRVEWSIATGRRTTARDALMLAEAALGPVLGDHTRTALANAASPEQGIALLLASPEFQRR